MFLLSAARFTLGRRYSRTAPSKLEASTWGALFAIGAGLGGAGWGAAGILLYPEAHLANQVFLVFILGGMMLGAASLLAPRIEAFLSFIIPAGLAPAMRLVIEGGEAHLDMGLLAGLFTVATLITTWRIHLTIVSSLNLQFENQDLVEELRVAKSRTEALNEQLEVRVQERTAELQQSTEQLRAEIKQREQAEIVLRESEERFRKIFEEGPIPMAFSGPDLHIRKVNGAFCRMLGRDERDLTKHTFLDFTHPDDIPKCRELAHQNFAGLTPNYRVEKRFFASDGRIVWVDVFDAVVRDSMGTPLYNLGMAIDISQHKRSEHALGELSARLMCLQDESRRRIARELHDITGQNLAALKLNLSRLARLQLPPGLAGIVPDSLDLAEKILSEVRTLAYLLHPPLLDELGLACALRAYVQGFSERSGISVHSEIQQDLGRLGPELETTMFRIIQEGLTNVQRHSGAQQCWVSLLKTQDAVALEVRDDGVGLRAQSLQLLKTGAGLLGVGLSGMRERVRQLGGRLEIESVGNGCTLRATFSLTVQQAHVDEAV
jgi:PAS domain S-box-containing protein